MYPQVQKVLGCRLMRNEYVIIHREGKEDVAIVLNHAASRAFALMDGRHNLKQIAAVLAKDTGVDQAGLEEPLRALLKDLEERGVVACHVKPWKADCPVRLRAAPPLTGSEEPPAIAQAEKLRLVASASSVGGQNCDLLPGSCQKVPGSWSYR